MQLKSRDIPTDNWHPVTEWLSKVPFFIGNANPLIPQADRRKKLCPCAIWSNFIRRHPFLKNHSP